MLRRASEHSSSKLLGSNFSSGKPLEYVETDKARVVLLELEKDWWIVAVCWRESFCRMHSLTLI